MERVLKRIALHGILTALALGLMGMLFTRLASFWIASAAPPRVAPAESGAAATNPVDATIRSRVPLTMAAFGFAFVAVSELLVFAVRGEKKPAVKQPLAAPDDPAEKLLEELLRQADIALAKQESGVGSRESESKKSDGGDAPHAASILTPDP